MCLLSVILVNWNAGHQLLTTLTALEQSLVTVPDSEVILIDNASTDDSTQMAAQKFPQLKVISNPTNPGFGVANNIGFTQARGRYVLLVNPDLQTKATALVAMLNFMETHPRAGMCGPKVVESDNVTVSPWCARRDPRPWDIFCEYAFLTRLFPRQRFFARYVMGDWDHASNREVDALTGACLLIRRDIIQQTGGFDERFFMYGEDIDWCRRIRQAGWQVWFVASAEVMHEGAHSTKQVGDHGSRWSLESYLHYFRKWGNPFDVFKVRLALFSGNLIRTTIWSVLSLARPRQFHYAINRAACYFRYALLAWSE